MLKLTPKQRFLFNEICILAWNASVQRAHLYSADINMEDRRTPEFRASILEFIENELLPQYLNGCDEGTHTANIEELVRYGTSTGVKILGPGGYKFGVAQKVLNLLLKYLWCMGHITEPPHCPVDRIILEKTVLKGKMNWTAMSSTHEYREAIAAIRAVASSQGLSIAAWELQCYARR